MCEIFVDEVVDATKIPAGDVNARKVNAALNSAGLGPKGLARDTMLRLMNVVQTYDLEHGCVVGEEQMCNYSHATRAAVRALRLEGGPRIPKLSVLALILSIMKHPEKARKSEPGKYGNERSMKGTILWRSEKAGKSRTSRKLRR